MREPRLPNIFKLAETLTNATLANSARLSVETSNFEGNASSNFKIDSHSTPATCQEAMVCGKIGLAVSSAVLSLEGTQHFERGYTSTLDTDPQVTLAKSQEEAACGQTAQYLDSSILPLDETSISGRSDSSVSKTIPQIIRAKRQQREANGIGPVNIAKRLKTAKSTNFQHVL